MAKDKDKLIAGAQKLVQKGQIDKAIKEFQKVLAVDKKDVKVHLRLGDLFSKKKDKENSIKHYCEAAKYYTKDGFYSKAVAVYKQALQLDDTRTDITFNLADLYHKLGLINDAMNQYQTVATHYERDGMVKEAIETIRRMAELDPRNVVVLTKLAELYYKNGMKDEGYEIFRRALDELKESGRFEEYTRLLEKMAKADPDNTENLKELCTIYLKRGVFDRAYQVLSRIYKNDPEDLESLQNLAQACVKINRADEGVELYKALASKYKSKGLNQKAKEALRKVLQIKPDDKDALKVIGQAAPKAEEPAKEEEPQLLEEEVEPDGEVIEALEELPEDEVTIKEEPPAPKEEPSKLTEDQILEHLTEADVYLKYGLKDKAVHHVQTVLKTCPDNIKAHQRLKDIQLDSGEKNKAISTLYKISELAKSQDSLSECRSALQEILSLDPGQSNAQDMMSSIGGASQEAEAEEEPLVVMDEPEIIEEAEEVSTTPGVAEEEEIIAKPKARAAAPVSTKGKPFQDELEEAEFYIQQGLEDEAVKIYLEILKQDPSHEESLHKLHELGATEAEAEEVVAESFELAPEEEKEEVAEEEEEPVEEIVEEEEAPVEFAEEEEEVAVEEEEPVEFAEEEGPVVEEEEVLMDEEAPVSFEPVQAKEKPSEPLAPEPPPQAAQPAAPAPEPAKPVIPETQAAPIKAPPGPLPEPPVVEKPAQALEPEPPSQTLTIEEPSAQAAPEAPPAPETADFIPPELGDQDSIFGAGQEGEDLFDLAAELEREDFGPAAGVDGGKFSTAEKFSFEDMFSAFKKGVEQQVSKEDSSTHYDLGIAYKEMGLLDDAVSEFRTAMSGSANPADCCLMMGICYQDKGQQEKAIETYREGLQIQGISDKEAVVFYYELGLSYLSMGEKEQARQMFEKAQSIDPGFRDVKEKCEELSKASPVPAPAPESREQPPASRDNVAWESAALNDADKATDEEADKQPKTKKKKISYV